MRMDLKVLQDILERVSDMQGELNFDMFKLGLKMVADLCFDTEYDSANSTNYAKLPPTKKLGLFYEEVRN